MRFDPAKHPHTRDLTGRSFGRLTVVAFAGVQEIGPRDKHTLWRCKCSCGRITNVTTSRLNYGWTTSCGCRQREASGENGKKNLRHGQIKTAEYYAYHAMKQRCLNPNYHHYKNWGGRGIKICKRWLDSFEAFFTDMGPKPSRHHSLERRNNSGNYSKANCRWATAKEQASNRRLTI
jgi:hypothetical protein